MKQIKVLLADDHNLVRAGIRSLLTANPAFLIVGEAETGSVALRLVRTLKPDVVLMDIAMADLNGLEATERIVREFPTVRVVILSMYSTREHVLGAMKAGAAGYLLKGAAASELEMAIKAAARGETYLSSAVSRHVVEALVHPGREADGAESTDGTIESNLTPRQREVLQLIAEGNTTKEIAEKLNISFKTVKTHRAQLMEQLGVHDTAALVRYAIRIGLVSSDS